MNDDTQDEGLLHQRLVSRDPIAPEEVARRYLPIIEEHVATRAWNIYRINDRELIWDASVDAIFGYIRHPEKFDTTKSGLRGYLKRAAERDLINAVERYRRQRRGEELREDVEEFVRGRNKPHEIARVTRDAERETIARIQSDQNKDAAVNVGNKRDNALLQLMIEGERSTTSFAAVLGIEALPVTEQRRIVKQHKDRLKVQLKRSKHRV